MNAINRFLHGYPRHRLVICDTEPDEIDFIDVGTALTECVGVDEGASPNDFLTELSSLVKESTYAHPDYGPTLAMKNLGILLERQLGLDFKSFLERTSRNCLVVLKWEGAFEGNILHFLSKEAGVKIDLTGINYIKL